MTKLGFRFVIVGIFLIFAVNNLSAQGRFASRLGEATVRGQRVVVHVTVVVPPGFDENAIAENALRDQGARPLQPAEFTVTGLRWDQFFNSTAGDDSVTQYYNTAGEPTAAAAASFSNAQNTWNSVGESKFTFSYGGTTSRCPSLVQECPGPQAFDGFNDVGWAAISGCCTLGVTWYSTSVDEADTALNTRFRWTTTGGSGYDIQTVLLHEIGHTLGLDHSSVIGAVMEATYAGVRQALHQDDQRGVTYLYPESNSIGDITGTVKSAANTPISGAKISIANLPVSATSDVNGYYELKDVPKIGVYSVTASAKGYFVQTDDSVFVGDTVNFTLQAGGCVPKGPNGNNCH
jgi:Matrixin/Carboxypeptidase regulatory-like domain